jgi:hypothetical protein
MNLIHRQHIDCDRWNKLVDKTAHATIYNKSFFLDVVSENWCIYVDEDYSKGIAIPFTQKLNYKCVYTPNFFRCLNFLGEITNEIASQIIEDVKREFSVGNLSIDYCGILLEGEERVYQKIGSFEGYTLNNLSKRMLKKFNQSGLSISEEINLSDSLSFLELNLFQRIEGLSKSDFAIFRKLINTLNDLKLLKKYAIYDQGNSIKGCILLVQSTYALIYIKGVASSEDMKQGAMYGLMNQAISLAKDNHQTFDFGGSNIDSIRQFYKNLGGEDSKYVRITWGEFPLYYKIAKYLYRYLRKLKK